MNYLSNHYKLVLLLFITLNVGIASAIKCYKCKEKEAEKCKDPIEKGNEKDHLEELYCVAPDLAPPPVNTTTQAAATEPTTAEPPADPIRMQDLLERDEAATGDENDATSDLGCIKLLYTKDGKEGIVRGCGTPGCKVTMTVMALSNGTCNYCKQDLCNLSVRMRPIEWAILLMVVAIFASFGRY